MITNYIPNTCKYSVNNLKKVVHIFSESENVIHIDNGEVYASSGITDFQTIYATSVDFAESTSFDDRFKFEKQITVTVDGFLKLDSLNEKYYVVLEDENGIMWLVNVDFPSFVTYTYTLSEGVDETVFTFNVLSNFPTLKLNASINNSYECKDYSLAKITKLKMNLKENCTIDHVNHIIYDSSNNPYYIVKFNESSLKVEETYDGFNVTTTIQFNINFDDYKASWYYNLLEYQDNKYVAVTDHLACGFEMGLVPSYNVQGSHQIGGGDTVTVTLVGTSQRGSEWAEEWTEATLIPDYIWLLSNEWVCETPPTPPEYRWITVSGGYECSGTTKMTQEKEQVSYDSGSTWSDVSPLTTRAVLPVIEYNSEDCGYIPPVPPTPTFDGKYKLTLSNLSTVSAECGSSSAISRSEISAYTSTLASAIVGNCVTSIGSSTFSGCRSLTSCTIGTGVTSIGDQAFDSCSGLTSIAIPDSVTYIGWLTFHGCVSLTNVTIPSGVTGINYGAFLNCSGLTSIACLATTPPMLDERVFDNTNNCPIYVPSVSVNTYKSAYGWGGYVDRIQGMP